MSEMETESESEPSMGDMLSEAFDNAESSEPIETPPESTPAEAAAPIQTGISGQEAVPEVTPAVGGDIKAPQSWGIPEREAWANLPPEIQAQVDKREREVNQVLQESSQARNFQSEFNQTVTPFLPFINAEGANPMSAFQNLMQTAATLQTAPPAQKAGRIAELIQHYGVDIKELDNILSGQMPSQQEVITPQMQAMQQQLDQQNTYFQNMATQQQQVRNQSQQQTQGEVSQFVASNEFAQDVKHQMADMMEMSAKRGESMTLQQAYENALLIRPDIQQVINQRKAANTAQQGNQRIRNKERAALSVPQGSPGMAGVQAPNSMRDQLSAAMDGD